MKQIFVRRLSTSNNHGAKIKNYLSNRYKQTTAKNQIGASTDLLDKYTQNTFKKTVMVGSIASVGSFGLLGPLHFIPYTLTASTILFGYIGRKDMQQTKHALKRNFPVIGRFRYFLESFRGEVQQYFIEQIDDPAPYSIAERSLAYQRSKNEESTQAFGTRFDLYEEHTMWLNHSAYPTKVKDEYKRNIIGNKDCLQPYSSSLLNISAMSFGALSPEAIESLNRGAKMGNFYHNTGEGSVSKYHKAGGGDIVWNIGTGYFGCRNLDDGSFSEEKFVKTIKDTPQIKMVEIKLSQGAKPGKGGVLPKSKITEDIAEARGIGFDKDCVSPPSHSAFNGPIELIKFVKRLRTLSGGLPIGFKLCVGRRKEFTEMALAMKMLDCYPDFITVDGSEGGTGAAPYEYTNFMGTPATDGLRIVHNILTGLGIREHTKIIVAGKVLTSFSAVKYLCIGADQVNAARAFMFSIGCIQSRKCNLNTCPTGIATNDPLRTKGLNVDDKSVRAYNFHKNTIQAIYDLIGSIGIDNPQDLRPEFLMIRMSGGTYSKNHSELFPDIEKNSLLQNEGKEYQKFYDIALEDIKKYA